MTDLNTEENQDIQEEINSSGDENLNEEDELDFYDFLEVVSDRIDNITTQSKAGFRGDEYWSMGCDSS